MVDLQIVKDKIMKFRVFDILTLVVICILTYLFSGIKTTTFNYSSQTDIDNPIKTNTYTTLMLICYLILCGLFSLFLCYLIGEPSSLYPCLLYYLFCIFSTVLITTTLKYLVARPRPDTLTLCGTPSSDDCRAILTDHNFFQQYQSFTSGHASLSMCGSIFLYSLLNEILPVNSFIFVFIKILPIFGSFLISFTRLWDFKHHTEDVVFGLLLGAVSGLISFKMYQHEIQTISNEQVQNKKVDGLISEQLNPEY